MVDWLRLTARHWFLLPPALLLLAVAFFLFLALQESPPPQGEPRPLKRWSEPIDDHRVPPRRWSAQGSEDPPSTPPSADPPGDRPPPTIGPDADDES